MRRIKKAYRRKALELHPDRNYGAVEAATTAFAEVSAAYEILSDPQERAWYDSHRDSILRGDSGSPEDSYQNVQVTSAAKLVNIMGRFNSRTPFTDAPTGFFGILNETFAKLAKEEDAACDWEGLEPVDYPEFGHSEDDFDDGVKQFYRVWISFSTKKTFSWRDEYRTSDAPDRQVRRLVEKENKRLRDEGIREFNEAVRSLVAFVRKRDPRFTPNSQTEAERQKILRDAAAAQAARNRAANRAKLDEQVVPSWAQTAKRDDLEGSFSSDEEEVVEEIECVVCDKVFKSEKQFEAHEKSKKHIKAVQQLKRQMQAEDKDLDLDVADATSKVDEITLVDEGEYSEDEQKQPAEISVSKDNEAISSEDEDSPPERPKVIPKVTTADTPASDLSDIDSEYAPRKDVVNRLASALDSEVTSTAASESGDATPKVGKAKAKRAKKAARQEQEASQEVGDGAWN